MKKLSEAIKFEASKGKGKFVLEASERELHELMVQMERSTNVDEHIRFGAALVPPIAQAVRYVEMYNIFFEDVGYGDMEDNRLPVEKDVVAMAWETHADGEILFVRPGYQFTRPDFTEWDAGVEIDWRTVRRAGWNVLERTMQRAVEELARKRDTQKKNALDTAILGITGHNASVSTTLTKAAVDAAIKAQAQIGYPLTRALINPGTFMDMAVNTGWTWGSTGFALPESVGQELITTLYYGNYGGIDWFTNPHCPTDYVYFGGPAAETGYHQTRGSLRTASDVDIRRKVDIHTIMDAEHAVYVGNAYRLYRLRIS